MDKMEQKISKYSTIEGRLHAELWAHYEDFVGSCIGTLKKTNTLGDEDWQDIKSECKKRFRTALRNWDSTVGPFTKYLGGLVDNVTAEYVENAKQQRKKTRSLEGMAIEGDLDELPELGYEPFEKSDVFNESPQELLDFLERCKSSAANEYEEETFRRLNPKFAAHLRGGTGDWSTVEELLFRRLIARIGKAETRGGSSPQN